MSLAEQQLFAKEPNNSFGPRDLVIRVGQTVARFRVQHTPALETLKRNPQANSTNLTYQIVDKALSKCSSRDGLGQEIRLDTLARGVFQLDEPLLHTFNDILILGHDVTGLIGMTPPVPIDLKRRLVILLDDCRGSLWKPKVGE
jgi:hypothetical protein